MKHFKKMQEINGLNMLCSELNQGKEVEKLLLIPTILVSIDHAYGGSIKG